MKVRKIREITPSLNKPNKTTEIIEELLSALLALFTPSLEGDLKDNSEIICNLVNEINQLIWDKVDQNPKILLPHVVLASIFIIRATVADADEEAVGA